MYTTFFQFLFQNNPDAVLLIGSDGRIIEANDAALNAYGYSHEEMLGLDIQNLCAPGAVFDVTGEISQASGKTAKLIGMHKGKKGNTFPVEMLLRSERLGKEKYLLGIIRFEKKGNCESSGEMMAAYEELKKAYEELQDYLRFLY